MAEVLEFENPELDKDGNAALVPTGRGKAKKNKTPGPQKGQGGRPRKEINWAQVEKMANIFLKLPDIANVLGISMETLERACKKEFNTTFAVWWKSKASNGKMALHRALLSEAIGLEHDGWVREKNGEIARDPDGYPLEDRRKQRKPNTLVLLYMAKHVLDMEQEGRGYDPEYDEGDQQDEREGTESVGLLVQFVGADGDEINETPAPGEEVASEDDESDEFPPVSMVSDEPDEESEAEYYDENNGDQW